MAAILAMGRSTKEREDSNRGLDMMEGGVWKPVLPLRISLAASLTCITTFLLFPMVCRV